MLDFRVPTITNLQELGITLVPTSHSTGDLRLGTFSDQTTHSEKKNHVAWFGLGFCSCFKWNFPQHGPVGFIRAGVEEESCLYSSPTLPQSSSPKLLRHCSSLGRSFGARLTDGPELCSLKTHGPCSPL